MKYAKILTDTETVDSENCAEVKMDDDTILRFAQSEYTLDMLEAFQKEADQWILQCKGSQNFLARSDSGEDAYGTYCKYFDLQPDRAVYIEGKLAGFYLCDSGIRYSGNGRDDFTIDQFGFPGDDVFAFVSWGARTHLFLFEDETTHKWKNWTLLVRDPQQEYKSYLKF